MCRLAGIISKGEFPHDKLIKMVEHQRRGGPDHSGFWVDKNVGFGHNRLSILDLSEAGNQPMHTDRWVLTYVGEIYNYQELKLKIQPRSWKSGNDTETLLFYIDEFGVDRTLQDIEGMYAFAAFDKFSQKLYLAVDPFGIKQIFTYEDENIFAFASSPAALTYLADEWALNQLALNNYLALGGTKEPLFKGMNRMDSGYLCIFDVDHMSSETRYYYDPTYQASSSKDVMIAVISSIRSIRLADVPVFLFLSGGVDSSIVASQCTGISAIHLASPEEHYARQVADKYNNPFIKIDPRDYNAEECLKDYSLQSGDCSMAAIIPYITSKEVSRYGKVGISANGADELFYGYDRIGPAYSESQRDHIFRRYFHLNSTWVHHKEPRIFELSTYVEYDLNKTLDFASMCHGLEMRVPYLNRSVVEAALSLSWEQHTNNGFRHKAILKEFLLNEGFDLAFVTRPKLGFSLHYEPSDYQELKRKGVEFLRTEFNIKPELQTLRDQRYYEASAAAFFCWCQVWQSKIKI